MLSHPLEISIIRNTKYNKDSYAKGFHFNSIEKLLPSFHFHCEEKPVKCSILDGSILVLRQRLVDETQT